MSLGRNARKESNLKIRQPLAELVIVPGSDAEREAARLFEDHFLEELNVKKVSLRDSAADIVKVTVAPVMKTLGPKLGRRAPQAKEIFSKLDPRILEEAFTKGETYLLLMDSDSVVVEPADVAISRSYGDTWAGSADIKTVVLLDKRVTRELKNEGFARDIIRNVQNLRKDSGLDIADRIALSLVTSAVELRDAIDAFRDYIAHETLATRVTGDALEKSAGSIEVDIEGQKVSIGLSKA